MDLFLKLEAATLGVESINGIGEKGRKETVRVDPNRLGGSGGARA